MVLEKTLENPLASKEIKSVNPKGNQLRIIFAVGLSYIDFIMLRYVPSIPAFWRVFIINGC